MSERRAGPLAGVTVLDLSALGPGPFCGMLLADQGADVIAIERPGPVPDIDPAGLFSRGKRSIMVDIRTDHGQAVVKRLAATADVVIESNRPGTLEQRGLGPADLRELNDRLIYCRLTGWGQEGPYAQRAGHDINYIAIGGALGVVGTDRPAVPLNIVGDFAGGSFIAAMGIYLALIERAVTGRGQVVDAAMVDGAALLAAAQMSEAYANRWNGRGNSLLSGLAPFYGVYQCSDGGWFAVGAIEPQFYDAFLTVMGLDDVDRADQHDRSQWSSLRARIAEIFAGQPRDHWTEAFFRVDACGDPVLDIGELEEHAHLRHRGTAAQVDGRLQPAPAPRLSEHGSLAPGAVPERRGAHSRQILRDYGYDETEVDALISSGAVAESA